jgi:hypothetical protein
VLSESKYLFLCFLYLSSIYCFTDSSQTFWNLQEIIHNNPSKLFSFIYLKWKFWYPNAIFA